MRRQPPRKKLLACCHVALLEHGVGETVRGVGVFASQRHGAFAESAADAQISRLDVRPAEIAQEPPVLAIVSGVALADRKLCGVVIGATGEGVETERAEQQGEDQCVARAFVQMLFGAGYGKPGLSFDGSGRDLDVAAFALACARRQLAGARRLGPGLGTLHIHLMNSRPRDIGQGEVRILCNGLVECIVGAMPGRQHAVDAVAVICRGALGRRRERQIVSVPDSFLSPHETKSRALRVGQRSVY